MEEVIAHLKLLTAAIKEMSDNIIEKLKGKLGKNDQAVDSAKLEGKTWDDMGASSQGRVGEIPFIGKENTNFAFAPAEMLTKFRMANTDAQINALKTDAQSFADIFSKWKRISHNTTGKYPALPEETTAWVYDDTQDTVRMPLNSSSVLGLVSPYTFDEYEFDVVVSSNNADDDGIGLILGFKVVNGVEHTLIAQVTSGGLDWNAFSSTITPRINVVINMGQGTGRGNKLVYAGELGLPRQGFNGADFSAGVRIRAVRKADGTMTVQAMRPDGTNFPAGEVKWSGAIPDLFKTPCAIGYMSYSQALSTYRNITVPQPKTDIIDGRNLDIHRWNNGSSSWSIIGKVGTLWPRGRMYRNTEGQRGNYYLDLEGSLIELTVEETTVSVNEYINLPAGATKEYDLLTLLGSFASDFDIKTAQVLVRFKDTNSASPMFDCYTNAEGIVSYGIRGERYVVIANQSAAAAALYVKVTVKPN